MRPVAPVFQLYRFSDDDAVWWRLVSPNGRGLARGSVPGPDPEAVRLELDGLAARLAGFETTIRLTPEYRWRWSLREDDLDVAQGIGDQDRRVRCVHACRTFVQLVPEARVDPVVATYRRAGHNPVLLRSSNARRGDLGP